MFIYYYDGDSYQWVEANPSSVGFTGSTGSGYTGSIGSAGYVGSIGYVGSTGYNPTFTDIYSVAVIGSFLRGF
jgi:hypothetical protein